ncbi:MAG TPA: hypothetical protein VGE74_18065 [Gemmata sp.]
MEAQLQAIARDVAALAANVVLENGTHGRTMPAIAPASLWRILPRLLERAAPHMAETERAFALALANTIQGKQPAPQIPLGKAV